ncbi:MAG: carboxypeptidase regulatory-like domain-containing protein [Acidobacteriota bacterium]|nr:carboxypeptidase regulatory-like domain-containing protein [Acidobacteriota bacterium]
MKIILRLAAAVVALGFVALPVWAQTSSAAITGHIVDQSKGVVPNAEVKLVEQSTNVAVTTHSNANGDFIFTNVQPGTYTAVVTASGYKELRKVGLVLSASQSLSAGTFVLQVGTVAQSVTVEADITPLQTTSSERSGVLDVQQMDNLLAIGRDAMALTRVMPGVVGGEGSTTLSTSGTPTVNGVNSEYNLATIDGVTGNTRGLGTLDTPINLDAVKEVTVLSSNYQAQYGKTAGANFNFVTKSGTQHFHGGLYYYLRNEALNANSWFNKYNGQSRPKYRYNTTGGTIGGPAYWPGKFNSNKNKLFFFVSIEYDPNKQPDGLKYYRIPTLAETQGDFSQTYNQGTTTQTPSTLIRIKNPYVSGSCSTNSATPGSGCFPNNQIPVGQINSQAQILLQTIYNNTLKKNPGFAFNDLAVSDNNYNYITNYSADRPVNQEIFRIDYFPTEKLHMFFRGDLTKVNDNSYSSPANKLPWLMPVNYQLSEPNFVYNVIYTFTPTLVNELNFGTAGWGERQLYKASDLAPVKLSSSGFNLPSLYAGVNPLNLFPAVSFGGVTDAATYGWDSRFPMADQVRSYELTDNVTKVIGNHTLKFGVDAGTDAYLQPSQNRVGTFAFGHDPNNPNDSNYAYSNTLLGNLDTYTQAQELNNYDPRTNALEWYYQDTWKARPNLTLDLGIRNSYDMAQRLHKGNNFVPSLFSAANAPTLYQSTNYGKNAVDPTTGKIYPKAYIGLMVPNTGNLNNGILYVNTKGYPQGTTYGDGLLWAPRVGFAYSPRSTTVIRGGFGIFYNIRARSGQEGDLTNNAPTTNSPTQYYSSVNSTASNYYAASGVSNLNGPFGIGHALPLHADVPYAEEGSLGVQHQFPFGVVLDVAYVGTFTKHATNYTPINEVPYGAEFQPANNYVSKVTNGVPTYSPLPDNFFRPYPGFGNINMQYFNLTANYNSLQVNVTRRFHNGLEFGAAYTFSRAMDYTDSYNGTVAVYQNLRQWNYGPAGWDRKHNLIVNYLWSIPKGSRLFGGNGAWNNPITRQVFDGWQISGIASYISGAPRSIGLKLSNGQNVTGGGDGARIVLTCDPMRPVHGTRSFHQWFNSGCVEPPIAGSVPTAANNYQGASYSTGNGVFAPRVNYFLPGDTNFDTALFKNMPIDEGKLTLQLRVETYNTFDHPEFDGVNATATFKTANSQDPGVNPQTASTFGQLSGTANPRYMQLALRLNF